jgi:hypothetical protein
MPGANCSIYGCGTSRKHVGVGIFRIPAETDELSKKTRKAWISIITKDRVVDDNLRRQIESGNLYVCEQRKCILFFYYLILRMKQQGIKCGFHDTYMRRIPSNNRPLSSDCCMQIGSFPFQITIILED